MYLVSEESENVGLVLRCVEKQSKSHTDDVRLYYEKHWLSLDIYTWEEWPK